MATVDDPTTHREEIGLLIDAAGRPFAAGAAAVTLGLPLAAYLSGSVTAMFYVHVALGALWFGTDLFFKFVLGPALEAAPDEAATGVNRALLPKMTALLEPLSLGVVGSGIGLAGVLGYWTAPSAWLHAALGLGVAMLLVGFGPLHLITTRLSVELLDPEPDSERLGELFGGAMRWGLLQTVLMFAMIGLMAGIRLGL